MLLGGPKTFSLKFHWRTLGQGSPKVDLDSHFDLRLNCLDVDQWTGKGRGGSCTELGFHNAAKTCGEKLICGFEFSAVWLWSDRDWLAVSGAPSDPPLLLYFWVCLVIFLVGGGYSGVILHNGSHLCAVQFYTNEEWEICRRCSQRCRASSSNRTWCLNPSPSLWGGGLVKGVGW